MESKQRLDTITIDKWDAVVQICLNLKEFSSRLTAYQRCRMNNILWSYPTIWNQIGSTTKNFISMNLEFIWARRKSYRILIEGYFFFPCWAFGGDNPFAPILQQFSFFLIFLKKRPEVKPTCSDIEKKMSRNWIRISHHPALIQKVSLALARGMWRSVADSQEASCQK